MEKRPGETTTEPMQLKEYRPGGPQWQQPVKRSRLEELTKNMAVAAALLICVVALRNGALPGSDGLMEAVLTATTGDTLLDDQLGKLTFVSTLFPEATLVFGEAHTDADILMPVTGAEVVHAWSQREPYVMLETRRSDVRAAADGEVMSIAHGLDEERIVRIRHDDHTETLYGNLKNCHVSEGDQLCAGDVFAELLDGKPLAFELRVDGRSVDPAGRMKEIRE